MVDFPYNPLTLLRL